MWKIRPGGGGIYRMLRTGIYLKRARGWCDLLKAGFISVNADEILSRIEGGRFGRGKGKERRA